MEEISVNGENYVKAAVLAKKFGYTADYLGQLCRSEQVKATLVGRSWYVNEDSLRQHRQQRYRSSAAKSKESLKEAAEFQKTRQQQAFIGHKLGQTRYEIDDAALIPVVPMKKSVDEATKLETTVIAEISSETENIRDKANSIAISRQNIILKNAPRPILRTLPAFAPTLENKTVVARRPAVSPVIRPAVPSAWYTSVAFLTVAVFSIEALIFFGALGLEKKLIVSPENTAMVLYGFDPSEAGHTLADTFRTQLHRFW